jgi:hypothetical protein
MKMRLSLFLCAATVFLFSHSADAKSAGNRPYVQSFPRGGPFYARCIPDEVEGGKGTTQILRVQKGGDELLHTYGWYNRQGVFLAWSPKAGKVAVMRVRQDEGKALDEQIELSFYLGGELVKSYTTSDLLKLGARKVRAKDAPGLRASYEPGNCRQVWNTNDYYFSIKLDDARTLRFDIVTGNLCRVVREGKRERMTTSDESETEHRR